MRKDDNKQLFVPVLEIPPENSKINNFHQAMALVPLEGGRRMFTPRMVGITSKLSISETTEVPITNVEFQRSVLDEK